MQCDYFYINDVKIPLFTNSVIFKRPVESLPDFMKEGWKELDTIQRARFIYVNYCSGDTLKCWPEGLIRLCNPMEEWINYKESGLVGSNQPDKTKKETKGKIGIGTRKDI